MTVLNTGANKKYTEGWQAIFGGKGPKQAAKKQTAVKKSAKKTSGKKKTGR